jgi:hypothetical protein
MNSDIESEDSAKEENHVHPNILFYLGCSGFLVILLYRDQLYILIKNSNQITNNKDYQL